LQALPNVAMNISQPVSSAIGSVDFGFLSPKEIEAISVRQIENPTTFDSFLNPIPRGLYDPALGAFGSNPYVTSSGLCLLHMFLTFLLRQLRNM
jgi:hypothetical protein